MDKETESWSFDTVGDSLGRLKGILESLGGDEARCHAEIFLEELLGINKAELYLNLSRVLSDEDKKRLVDWVKRRKLGEPLAYILGQCFFWDEILKVNQFCLIPRPETECLVDKVSARLAKAPKRAWQVLDLGAGTGAIGIALARQFLEMNVCFVDKREEPLQVVRENLKRYRLGDRARLVRGDLLRDWAFLPEQFWDVAVSNPPYIPTKDLKYLMPEVQKEPQEALDGGPDGLDFYRAIVKYAPKRLKDGAILALEIGIGQASQVKEFLDKSGFFKDIEVSRDLAGIERVIVAQKLG